LSELVTSYELEQLEPSQPPPRDAPARLLARARAEAQQIRDEARDRGYAEGHAAGHEQARSEIEGCAEVLTAAVAGIEQLQAEVAEQVERDAIEFALALAAKIVGGALATRPELVVEVLVGALRRASAQRGVTVLLNPDDYEHVRAALDRLQAQAGPLKLRDLQPDQRVARGGVVVRTVDGEVDARIQTQLERAAEEVAAELSTLPSV
jgi:flagellar assembly protein FliH